MKSVNDFGLRWKMVQTSLLTNSISLLRACLAGGVFIGGKGCGRTRVFYPIANSLASWGGGFYD
jgi:hypothetical protein